MKVPEIQPAAPNEVIANTANGQGYWRFLPENPEPFEAAMDEVTNYGGYLELPAIMTEARSQGSVLVSGEPGSGKSHLIRDIQTACVVNNVPCFCLTMHVNGGNRRGAQNVQKISEEFVEAAKANGGGVVILDNVDYLGYKTSSRSAGTATEYANTARDLVTGFLRDPNIITIGTAHNDEWRAAHWRWNRAEIDEPAAEVLDEFAARMIFEGKMTLTALAHMLHSRLMPQTPEEIASGKPPRPYPLGVSARVIRGLHQAGLADFFHANHVSPELFLRNPDEAITAIEAGRQRRTTRT